MISTSYETHHLCKVVAMMSIYCTHSVSKVQCVSLRCRSSLLKTGKPASWNEER